MRNRANRASKGSIEAIRFILAEYGLISSHGDSICVQFGSKEGTISGSNRPTNYFLLEPPLSGGDYIDKGNSSQTCTRIMSRVVSKLAPEIA